MGAYIRDLDAHEDRMKLKVEMLDERERTGRKGSATISALTPTAVPTSTISSARLPFDFVKSSSFKAILSPVQPSAPAPNSAPSSIPSTPDSIPDSIHIPLMAHSSLPHISTEADRTFSSISTSTSDLSHIVICASCSSKPSTVGKSNNIVKNRSIGTETETEIESEIKVATKAMADSGSSRITEENKKIQGISPTIFGEKKDKMTQTLKVAEPLKIETISQAVTATKVLNLEPERKKSSPPIIAVKKLSKDIPFEEVLLPVERELEGVQILGTLIDKGHRDSVEKVVVSKELKEIEERGSESVSNFGPESGILTILDDETAINDENSDTEDDEEGEREADQEREGEREEGGDKEGEEENNGGKEEMGEVGVRERRIRNSRMAPTSGLDTNS